jgi:predicted amidohydrolase
MDSKLKDKKYNIGRARKAIERLEGKVDIACLPEFFSTGYNLDAIGDDFYNLAETIPGKTTELIGKTAKEEGVAVVGSIVERDSICEEILYDTAFAVDSKGMLVGKYRKFYLYPSEHKYFKPGSDLSVFDLGAVRVGIAICYDHAFPELFRVFALKGVQIVFILSAIPKGYEYLLNLRARARAQDNQIFIAHVNRVGTEENIEYCGLSKVIDPRGEVLVEASADEEETLLAQVDLELVSKEKKQERVLKSLRPEIYEQLARLL